MKYKTPHKTYIFLLLLSSCVTGFSFLVQKSSWATIFASIGTGGIASVCVAWLLDIRNTKINAIDNKRKIDEIMNQFVRIYRKLLWVTANECFGYRNNTECRSFQDWLILLRSIEPYCPKEGQSSMNRRCSMVSGSIVSLQKQIEIFQSQSATLVFEEFPEIEKALDDLELLWIHCWGTLQALESENYSVFCDTAYILYTDFIGSFPQYKERFPEKYSVSSL